DTYEELTTNAKASREVAEEWKQRVALWEEEVQRTNDRYQQLADEHMGTKRKLGETAERLETAQQELVQTRRDLQQQALLTRAHAHHEQALSAAAFVLQASLRASTEDAAQLVAKCARMADGQQQSLQAAADIRNLVAQESGAAQQAVSQDCARGREQTQALLAALEAQVGDEFERLLGQQLSKHAEDLDASLRETSHAAQQQQDAERDAHAQAAARVGRLAESLHAAATDAAARGGQTCTELATEVRTHGESQHAALAQVAAAVRALVDACSRSTAEVLRQAQAQAAQANDALRAEAAALKAAHAAEVQALRANAQELAKRARDEDAQFMADLKAMVERRRERDEAALAAAVDAAESQAEARARSSARLAEQSTDTCQALGVAAAEAQAEYVRAGAAAGSQLDSARDAQHASAQALDSAVSAHAQQISSCFDAHAEAAAATRTELEGAAAQAAQAADAMRAHAQAALGQA
ncbi:hypothetical protein LPJ70_006412, partial [Coemansia sp. RSA 2708]